MEVMVSPSERRSLTARYPPPLKLSSLRTLVLDLPYTETVCSQFTVVAVAWRVLRSTVKHHNFIKITDLIRIRA